MQDATTDHIAPLLEDQDSTATVVEVEVGGDGDPRKILASRKTSSLQLKVTYGTL
jgi:hypothetical protein